MRKNFLKFYLSFALLACSFLLLSHEVWSDEQARVQAQAESVNDVTQRMAQDATNKGTTVVINGVKYGHPDAIKEEAFRDANLVRTQDGGYDLRPHVKERTVISNREVVNPDGTTEFYPQGIDKALQERAEQAEAVRAKQTAQRQALLAHSPDDKDTQREVQKMADFQEKADKELSKNDESLKKAKEQYDVPKVFISLEKHNSQETK